MASGDGECRTHTARRTKRVSASGGLYGKMAVSALTRWSRHGYGPAAEPHLDTYQIAGRFLLAEFIYTMRKTRKAHGDKVILDDVTLSFLPGAKIGVVGPNGAGKSTVLKIMAGLEQPSNGDAFLSPGYSVGILLQEPPLDESKTVLENVQDGVAVTKGKLDRFNEIAEQMATDYSDELLEEMGKLQEDLDHSGAWDLDAQLEQAMDALGCPPGDWPVTTLSGGEKRRVALCKLLLEAPDLLLLDEPTNHLDAESVNWLEQHLAKYAGTVVAITHDRYFLDNVAEWILELDRGRAIGYEGNYSTYLEKKQARLKVEGQKDAKRAKRLKEELDWVRSNAKGRQAKSRARLTRYEEMAAEAEKTRKLDFEEIQIPPGPRLGSVVVEVENLSKAFGEKVLIDDLSFTLPRNGIVGVIGPNGAGKTTLFKMIQGLETADAGSIKVGETVKISYVDQSRANIDPKKTLWAVVSDELDYINVGQVEMPSRAYVSAFGFKGPDQQKPAGVLSGGERNRLNLALTLKQGGNLLLLDEPTNDLDVETLSSLENALLDFPGCAVVVSHDRWFLDRVATHILAYEGESKWFWFEGNFESYEKNKIERLGPDAARPHRATYKKLTRG
ncbi:ABC transporter related protein [Streptomyces rapamycinicus NRRL 5491]|uniref:Energy-dependent translational throttle protein EttA n=1 Tax=Streptomyces rapamycinicus (strain ATCC 29253 / DSM 41530 / NRRL 5491 / AYB-994) TaxID=1343740 RepID=A0A3L8RHK3_STRRN|nr:ABC transporter related protein [Streptomyces rapamycinicus NRRL 5491]